MNPIEQQSVFGIRVLTLVNNESTQKLRGVLELFLENASRINTAKPKYWYPLAMASYGLDEILEAIDSMCSFRTTMWEKTQAFEAAFAAYLGVEHAVMVNSGSSADLLMCFALMDRANPRLLPMDKVLVPAVTWPTQIWSPMMAGLEVVLVDVDPETLNINVKDLLRKLSPRVKAIFLVHLMGLPCEMRAILEIAKERNLIVIEDCCEALGSCYGRKKVGTFGLASSFSFFFSHHCCTMEGGMVCTNDDALARSLRVMRSHGWTRNIDFKDEQPMQGYEDIDPRYAFVNWGFNLRPTELAASFGLHQLKKLPAWNETRIKLAEQFYHSLNQRTLHLTGPKFNWTDHPAWFGLPIMVSAKAPFKKTELTAYLEGEGVETRPIVTGNVARHPVNQLFQELQMDVLWGADAVHDFGFYLGLSPFATEQQIERLVDLLSEFPADKSYA